MSQEKSRPPYNLGSLYRMDEQRSKESEVLKNHVTALLRMLHKIKTDEGRPKNYVLTNTDVYVALNLKDGAELTKLLHRCYGLTSLRDVLKGVDLPFEKEVKAWRLKDVEATLLDYAKQTRKKPTYQFMQELAEAGLIPEPKDFASLLGEGYKSVAARVEARILTS